MFTKRSFVCRWNDTLLGSLLWNQPIQFNADKSSLSFSYSLSCLQKSKYAGNL